MAAAAADSAAAADLPAPAVDAAAVGPSRAGSARLPAGSAQLPAGSQNTRAQSDSSRRPDCPLNRYAVTAQFGFVSVRNRRSASSYVHRSSTYRKHHIVPTWETTST